jgi:hypothetical protein
MKEFNKTYGDFMSPFAKDMARYGEMIGGIRNVINEAYSKGIDLTRSPEGRIIIGQLVNSIDPREYNAMRANAKIGYEYLDALQKLRSAGKYSQAQEDFDLALSGTTPFSEFATSDGSGGLNSWNRPSPI